MRQGWSGKSPSRSHLRQKSSVESSRSSASGALRGPPRSSSPQVSAQKPVSFSRSLTVPRATPPSSESSMSLVRLQLDAVAAAGGRLAELAAAPGRRLGAVGEARQALHLDLDLAVDAGHRPQQRVVGLVFGLIGREPGPACSTQSPIVSASWTTTQPVSVTQVVSITSVPGS